MSRILFITLFASAIFADDSPFPVRIMTDGFNCKEGIIIADQIRTLVKSDTLLRNYDQTDSTYIIVEITSYQDGGTAVINAGFSKITPLQKFKLDYVFTRRLVSKTLVDMQEISANVIDKIHLIHKN